MVKNQYTQFKEEIVIPTLLGGYLDEAFPSMEFVDKGNRWISKYHLDGSNSSKSEKCYIYKSGSTLFENGGEHEGIFNFAMTQYGTDFMETLKRLCGVCNIPLPEADPEYTKRMEAAKRKQNSLNASMEKQQAALFSPEGKVVLDYLHDKRGYKDETIKAMHLGLLTKEEAEKLYDMGEFGAQGQENEYKKRVYPKDFPLSIPYISKGKLRGFKFRYVTEEAAAKYGTAKYRNTDSLGGKMKALPFLYSPNNIKDEVICVEGEFDMLHAYTRGIKNIIATSGGQGLTGETLSLLRESGTLKRVIFIPDNDQNGSGYKIAKAGIKLVEEADLEAFVVTLPDGIKDVDEYLTKHSADELKDLIEHHADKEIFWKYNRLLDDLRKKYPEDYLSDLHQSRIKEAVYALINSCKDETDRHAMVINFAQWFNVPNAEAEVEAEANRLREKADDKARADKAKDAANTYSKLVAEGKIGQANAFMAEALAELKLLGGIGTFGDLLRIPTRAERLARFRDKPEALETSYKFDNGGEPLPLTLPSGALTMVAAPTSHGKSTFLRNLALDVAKRYEDKSVLYFTFEESEEDVIAQFTNTYINKQLHAPSQRHPQLENIVNFYRTGKIEYMSAENTEDFKREEAEFFANYLDNGKIRIYYRDYNLETLVDALEFAVSRIPTKAVFIDYIQILRSQKLARQPRNEQLKEICISLKDFSVKHKLPVVLAAQLNREAKTPFRMDNNQMAESSDIEKAANTIVCLWNSSFKASSYGDKGLSKEEKEELKTLKNQGFELGKGGKIFAKLTKKRGGRGVGMYALLTFNGYSGKIVENFDPNEKEAVQEAAQGAEQTELPFNGADLNSDDPF